MIALVSAHEARDLDTDLPVMVEALAEIGVRSSVQCWDDDAVDWSQFEVVALRSTWNYMRRLDDFQAWLDRVDQLTRLVNPIDVVRWSLDKRYLHDLAALGVPTVPSRFIAPGQEPTITEPGDIVVKPAVSAGSNDTARYRPDRRRAALAHIGALLEAGRVVLVQPYQDRVDTAGETAVVCFGGQVSHAFGKGPILAEAPTMVGGVFAQEVITARVPTSAELAVVEQVLAAVPGGRDRLTYARIDLLPGADGPVVLEVELAEPSVYVHLGDGAAARFAQVLAGLRRSR